jgi:PncC family amidohydrolase
VAYSNKLKTSLLGIDESVLAVHGAVSESVARQMAQGARTRLGAGVAVAVTGIAGPGGGTAEKPVGLVYLAVSGESGTVVIREVFEGNRERIKAKTAEKALQMLLEYLE